MIVYCACVRAQVSIWILSFGVISVGVGIEFFWGVWNLSGVNKMGGLGVDF